MNSALVRLAFALVCVVGSSRTQRFEPFQDPIWGEFGLVDLESATHSACLRLKFQARLYNYNLNGTPIESEPVSDFASQQVRLRGFCTLPNEVKRSAQLQASWKAGERQRLITLKFGELQVQDGARRHQHQEVRWALENVLYREQYKGQSVTFSSISSLSDSTSPNITSATSLTVISAPINQKFVCRDKVNITLANPHYRRIVMELLPEIDIEPMRANSRFGSNVYLCERTRRRTLAESFQSRMTIFSGVVLGISSVSLLVGYSLRRQLQRQPELAPMGIAGSSGQAQQPHQFYGSF